MKTQAAKGEMIGNQLMFSSDYSVLGVMLWCVNQIEPLADGSFKMLGPDYKTVPLEVYRKMQAEIRSAVDLYEKRV